MGRDAKKSHQIKINNVSGLDGGGTRDVLRHKRIVCRFSSICTT
jgi:hypothetical protein